VLYCDAETPSPDAIQRSCLAKAQLWTLDFWFSGLHVDNLQMWIRVAAWDFFST
jgi:hypothetical protein